MVRACIYVALKRTIRCTLTVALNILRLLLLFPMQQLYFKDLLVYVMFQNDQNDHFVAEM